jgi:hypothetical protein
MAKSKTPQSGTNEIVILGRLLGGDPEGLPPEVARFYLAQGFNEEEKARMHDLAVRNQEGKASPEEREELFAYSKAGCLLGILHSKARMAMKAGKNKAS